jgi:hypothetical protein
VLRIEYLREVYVRVGHLASKVKKMASCNEIVRQIRQQVHQYCQSLTGCKSALDIETATRAFVTCIVSLGVKDHYAEIVSATMPQDYEEQKDPVGESEASLLKLLR